MYEAAHRVLAYRACDSSAALSFISHRQYPKVLPLGLQEGYYHISKPMSAATMLWYIHLPLESAFIGGKNSGSSGDDVKVRGYRPVSAQIGATDRDQVFRPRLQHRQGAQPKIDIC